jgi:hypothetical protein
MHHILQQVGLQPGQGLSGCYCWWQGSKRLPCGPLGNQRCTDAPSSRCSLILRSVHPYPQEGCTRQSPLHSRPRITQACACTTAPQPPDTSSTPPACCSSVPGTCSQRWSGHSSTGRSCPAAGSPQHSSSSFTACSSSTRCAHRVRGMSSRVGQLTCVHHHAHAVPVLLLGTLVVCLYAHRVSCIRLCHLHGLHSVIPDASCCSNHI